MAAISIVNTERLHPGLIFDPEHYHPERLAALAALNKSAHKRVSDYFDEVTLLQAPGPNDSKSMVFDLTDALGWVLTEGECPAEVKSAKKFSRPGDIIVSRLRSYLEEICLVPSRGAGFAPLLSTEFIVLREKNGKDGAWLLPFLLSSQAQTVLRWSQTGSNHPRFSSSTLLGLSIAREIVLKKEKIGLLVREAVDRVERARNLYPEAEQELLERLGWEKIKNNADELFFIERISETNKRGRTDAEHFQPKYLRLRERLKKIGASKLGDLTMEIAKGTQPGSYYDEGPITVVKSKNVFGHGIDFAGCERTSADAYEDVPARLADDDVVMNSTGFGTLGRAAFVPHITEKTVAAVDLLVLRLRKDQALPEYVTLFLNTQAGLWQSEMFQTGSSGQLHLYPQHVKDMLVFLPRNKDGSIDLAWQRKLSDKVTGASRAKQEARIKLNQAKKLVEDYVAKAAAS